MRFSQGTGWKRPINAYMVDIPTMGDEALAMCGSPFEVAVSSAIAMNTGAAARARRSERRE